MPRIFNFVKENGKWKAVISGNYAWYMFETFGFPPEMLVEEINNFNKVSLLKRMMTDWSICLKEGLVEREKTVDFEEFNSLIEKICLIT